MSNVGILSIDVWPAYVGVGESTDDVTVTEQIGHRDYERGQIWWETKPDGRVVGHARVCLPKGVFTHLMWCHGPVEKLIGISKLEQPIIFDRSGFFDVSPIENQDYLPRQSV